MIRAYAYLEGCVVFHSFSSLTTKIIAVLSAYVCNRRLCYSRKETRSVYNIIYTNNIIYSIKHYSPGPPPSLNIRKCEYNCNEWDKQ